MLFVIQTQMIETTLAIVHVALQVHVHGGSHNRPRCLIQYSIVVSDIIAFGHCFIGFPLHMNKSITMSPYWDSG